ncbi:OmpW/AlkL family protein [Bibersteinia trehalosi]|nr:OmpW family protein [Bibersteinia trehalosi]
MKKTTLALMLGSALVAGSAIAHEAGSTHFRVGGVFVNANSHSKTTTSTEVKLDVRDNQQLGLTATYMFTDNIGVELLGATPFSHSIDATVPAVNAVLNKAVKVKHLPPSLYMQYYFLDKDAAARPYLGAGVNYTRFFNAKAQYDAISNLDVKKHSFGPVVNGGIDIKVADNVYLNAAMWYTHIRTKAKFTTTGIPAEGVVLDHEVKIKLDPVIYFAGLTYKF